ncbi:helix-hairpin-helix domain-containing protein [Anaerobacillus alkaliphilus]|nr:helix-hairpin-helix domain-containing protein [Anaerobacillus alkaliphilus]
MLKLKRNSLFLLAVCTIALVFSVSLFRSFDNSRVTEDYFQASVTTTALVETEKETHNPSTRILVDIKGAIVDPGVYEMHLGDRVIHAIEKASGFLSEANPDMVNLALILEDEMVIYVPWKGEEEQPQITSEHVTKKDTNKININNATSEELQKIPGIGPAKASAIVTYREEAGKFKSIEDVVNVPGIGAKTLEKIAEFIVVK